MRLLKVKKIFIPLLAVSLLFSGCGKQEDVEEVVEALTPVEVDSMSGKTITREVVYAGQVKPKETVNVTSKLSGQVESIYFDVGDTVNAGDTMFTIDKKDIQDQIKQLEASLNLSNASVVTAKTGLAQVDGGQAQSSRLQLETAVKNAQIALDNAKISLENSEVSLNDVKARLDDTRKTYKDTKTLYDAGIVAKADFDSIELALVQLENAYTQALNGYNQSVNANTQAQTQYDQAVDALKIYDEQITSDNKENAQNSVETALANRDTISVQLQVVRDSLNDTVVKAPISGIITEKNIEKTNIVSAQSVPFTIVDMSSVTVDVNVSEKIINLISVGQNIDVVIPTINSNKMVGVIKSITPAADNTSTYPVKIEIQNTDGSIKPGMFAEIHFIENHKDNTMVVPRNTIIETDADTYVYIVEDNIAHKVSVTTGIDNGEYIEILSGVSYGDSVIVNGQNYVEDGDSVNIVNNSTEAVTSEQETAAAKEE